MIKYPETKKEAAEILLSKWNEAENVVNTTVEDFLYETDDVKVLSACAKMLNMSISPNGALFRHTDDALSPTMLRNLGKERKKYKKKMFEEEEFSLRPNISEKQKDIHLKFKDRYDMYQKSVKVAMNSKYGADGNIWSRYYSLAMAEGVTLFGQFIIRKAEIDINKRLNELFKTKGVDYCVCVDTDSNYFRLDKVFKMVPNITEDQKVDLLNNFGEKYIRPVFEKSFREAKELCNSYEQTMFMDREVIAERGIWTGKKRYILNVWDKEGIRYPKPKAKIMGMEAIRSTYPQVCRDKIKEAYLIMIEKDNETLVKFIEDFKEEFKSLDPQDIAENTSISGITKYRDPITGYYMKGAPHHVKAAYGYNKMIDTMKLGGEYEKIQNGSKIKLIRLISPNTTGEKKIAFTNVIPKEFDIEQYIDYDAQFEKCFLNPVKSVATIIEWETKKRFSLNFLKG